MLDYRCFDLICGRVHSVFAMLEWGGKYAVCVSLCLECQVRCGFKVGEWISNTVCCAWSNRCALRACCAWSGHSMCTALVRRGEKFSMREWLCVSGCKPVRGVVVSPL
jgi:hypothetical protein